MLKKEPIYDSASRELSLEKLIQLYHTHNVTHIYYKLLSPNDNSKNQPYLAGHLTDLGFLPTGEITETDSNSGKTSDPKRKIKYFIGMNFSWLSPQGKLFPAPDAKLIYYPQYPEVRLSGFVARCGFDMAGWMDPARKGRAEGRVLFLGVTSDGRIIAWLATPGSRIAREILDFPGIQVSGVFNEISIKVKAKGTSSRDLLLQELKRVHQQGWIESKRLNADGTIRKYTAQNGGGYTLEAELGITPNGYAEPDYLGWEVKQFGVNKCNLINSKTLTVMTPEPDGGYYVEHGVEAFIIKFGYKSSSIKDRLDFTGRHFAGVTCASSNLLLVTQGYDSVKNVITDATGCIALLDKNGNPASSWSFSKLMDHWKRKHSKAVYIPSISGTTTDKTRTYNYCNNIRLFEGTSFVHLLNAINSSHVYYDPGIKLEHASTCPKTKRRSQFRIKSSALNHLYEKQTDVDVLQY